MRHEAQIAVGIHSSPVVSSIIQFGAGKHLLKFFYRFVLWVTMLAVYLLQQG
jgi:hypothetical protein